MGQFNYKVVMTYLKSVLRKRKTSYKELSVLVQVPESTLKKWFISEDGTFNRVNIICNALGLTLNDVLIALDQRTVITFILNKKSQDYFLKDRVAFAVYWLLVYERMINSEIIKELKITEKTLKKSLHKLDQLNLIRLEINDKVTIPKATPVRWAPDGDFMKKLYQNWSDDILNDCLDEKDETQLFLQYFQITDASKDELEREVHLLEEKYARRTIQEMSTHGSKLNRVRFLTCIADGRFSLTE